MCICIHFNSVGLCHVLATVIYLLIKTFQMTWFLSIYIFASSPSSLHFSFLIEPNEQSIWHPDTVSKKLMVNIKETHYALYHLLEWYGAADFAGWSESRKAPKVYHCLGRSFCPKTFTSLMLWGIPMAPSIYWAAETWLFYFNIS